MPKNVTAQLRGLGIPPSSVTLCSVFLLDSRRVIVRLCVSGYMHCVFLSLCQHLSMIISVCDRGLSAYTGGLCRVDCVCGQRVVLGVWYGMAEVFFPRQCTHRGGSTVKWAWWCWASLVGVGRERGSSGLAWGRREAAP